jgi:uncharacterized protein YjbJ (UPF0337 family)
MEIIMVDENEFGGAAREFGGRVRDAVGGLTGDASTQAKGKWNQAAGQVQRTFGEASDELRENVTSNPLLALAIVGGVGFALGFLARR